MRTSRWDLGTHLYYLRDETAERYAAKLGMEIAHRDRVWLPGTVYTRERFTRRGRSRVRNAVKRAIVLTPGAPPTLRWVMLRRQADNPVYTANVVLRRLA
ncbi:MAG: hypothetical protein ACRDHF_15145 [Tepidiformaceae bacterium]